MKHHRGVWEMQPDQTEIESNYHKIAGWSTKLVEVSSHIWVTWHFCDLELSSRGEGECCGAQWLAEQKCWWVAWMVAWRYSATSAAGIFCVLLVLLNTDWRDLNWLFFRDCVQIKSDFFCTSQFFRFCQFHLPFIIASMTTLDNFKVQGFLGGLKFSLSRLKSHKIDILTVGLHWLLGFLPNQHEGWL